MKVTNDDAWILEDEDSATLVSAVTSSKDNGHRCKIRAVSEDGGGGDGGCGRDLLHPDRPLRLNLGAADGHIEPSALNHESVTEPIDDFAGSQEISLDQTDEGMVPEVFEVSTDPPPSLDEEVKSGSHF